MASSRRDLIAKEIVRLQAQSVLLERDWRRIPYLGASLAFALPAWWIGGPTVGLYAVLAVPCLILTAVYLIGARRSENREQIAGFKRQLAKMDAAAERAEAA